MAGSGKYSRRQILTLGVFGIADFFNAICVSLQAPFFPNEAERKGATAEEYGLVFGIFELVVFIVSPIYGQYIECIGPRTLFHGGILLSGICVTLFGFLDLIQDHFFFISSAFLVRIIEAMGNAAFLTASFSIIANEFPDNVGTAFAALETFFGFGLIVGPTLGGILYEIGGYVMPFALMGGLLLLTAVLTKFLLPKKEKVLADRRNAGKLLAVLKIEGIPVCTASIISTSTSIGFYAATLEPHLRQFNLTPIMVGMVFLVTGATYALSATGWGWLSDKYFHPKLITIVGGVLLLIGVALVGPAPFIPLQTSLQLVIVGLIFHGLGIGARLVASFTDALHLAVKFGLQNDLETYGLVSGLWTSAFALGAFFGPTISGILYHNYGFENASLFLIALVAILVVIELIMFVRSDATVRRKNKDYTKLDGISSSNRYDDNNCCNYPADAAFDSNDNGNSNGKQLAKYSNPSNNRNNNNHCNDKIINNGYCNDYGIENGYNDAVDQFGATSSTAKSIDNERSQLLLVDTA